MKNKVQRVLINESITPDGLRIITRFKSFSEIRNGIFTTLQRIKFQYPNAFIYYKNPDIFFTKAFLERNPECKLYENEEFDLEITPNDYLSWKLLPLIAKQIEEDLNLYESAWKWQKKLKVKIEDYSVFGKKKHLYIHPSAIIYPNVVFDVSSGPIIIDKNVKISPFSFLEGPLYIAEDAQIDDARIGGASIIGQACRIGGEVENTIFENFSNKHHEGFVGHSHIGSWVNIGALATTSDLKNNYGIVKIKIGEKQISTDTIKFGSIIGDFSKIAIGVMLNTGTVVDIGSNVIKSRVGGYIHPFSWSESQERYRLDTFIQDTKKIMARRNQTLRSEEEALLKKLYEG
ncbi:MAG TPA: glucose-1-phosphate thymidylyltransferase [Leptospiraceae bacterium]|nr:glucose-1-phosphate thymidylyltransferase [Leptospiraceae bacterium]HMW06312.1 glucose-1-phosphate thymidylyltransferase [Leptospiraceae bacterium]HMX31009.1 glucose-1-phosphate thymidylyltransferase [Leptospiraceae bacterium]HMY32172.1 glucose-1-phosphate thymidylyltransferase [Leptospiraceae bacterium]HMZ65099.1 glucose-1-phosphate thymidylyltransferase [Leptospiraceae bacterium]